MSRAEGELVKGPEGDLELALRVDKVVRWLGAGRENQELMSWAVYSTAEEAKEAVKLSSYEAPEPVWTPFWGLPETTAQWYAYLLLLGTMPLDTASIFEKVYENSDLRRPVLKELMLWRTPPRP